MACIQESIIEKTQYDAAGLHCGSFLYFIVRQQENRRFSLKNHALFKMQIQEEEKSHTPIFFSFFFFFFFFFLLSLAAQVLTIS